MLIEKDDFDFEVPDPRDVRILVLESEVRALREELARRESLPASVVKRAIERHQPKKAEPTPEQIEKQRQTVLVEEATKIFERTIPEKYRQFYLTGLQPSHAARLPLEEQSKLIEEMKAHPLDGWAFFTPAGFGKTTCSYVLYKQAIAANLKQWLPARLDDLNLGALWNFSDGTPRIYVWRKSVPDLLQQHFSMFNGEDVKPDITVEKIEEAVKRGFTPRVFLEEIDKIKLSEFSINQMFRIFDALDRHKGQIVLDTNMSKAEFIAAYGEPIARRVKENCHIKEYGF